MRGRARRSRRRGRSASSLSPMPRVGAGLPSPWAARPNTPSASMPANTELIKLTSIKDAQFEREDETIGRGDKRQIKVTASDAVVNVSQKPKAALRARTLGSLWRRACGRASSATSAQSVAGSRYASERQSPRLKNTSSRLDDSAAEPRSPMSRSVSQ